MNFISDNAYGAAPHIMAALGKASEETAPSYGEDALSARVQARLSALFERDVYAAAVVTGTAANALALASLCPPHGAILCSAQAHIAVDECGAPEFFSGGAKLVPLSCADGKLTPRIIEQALPALDRGVHGPKPSAVSITQATELGTVYTPAEIAAIAACAHRHGMTLHIDGARFANAVTHLKCAPADITWRAGVDALSFGATKNGALCADAVIFFDKARVGDFEVRRKRGGHLLSKMRFLSAQLDAYLDDDAWLKQAARANMLASSLASALRGIADIEIAHPVEANSVFVWIPSAIATRLRAAGAQFYDWETGADGRILARLVLSFATPQDDVARFVAAARA